MDKFMLLILWINGPLWTIAGLVTLFLGESIWLSMILLCVGIELLYELYKYYKK